MSRAVQDQMTSGKRKCQSHMVKTKYSPVMAFLLEERNSVLLYFLLDGTACLRKKKHALAHNTVFLCVKGQRCVFVFH